MADAEKLSLINQALALIGDDEIDSLSEGSERSTLAVAVYDLRLDEALGMARWRFATRQLLLIKNATDPIGRWGYAYDLPDGTATVYTVNDPVPIGIHALTVNDIPVPFDRYGSQLYCEEPGTEAVILDYLFRPDETVWGPRFKGAFVDLIAADLALSKDTDLHDRLIRRANDKLKIAASLEAQERTTRKLPTVRFAAGRKHWHAGMSPQGSTGSGGGSGSISLNASSLSYDNSVSLLVATNVQDAIDEIDGRVDTLEAGGGGGGGTAASITYSNTTSGLTADDVQEAIDEIVAEFLPLAGGTMTGFITLHATPTAAFHAATKEYVDAATGGGALTKATTAQAEAGTDDAAYMTPLKTAQAIAAQLAENLFHVREEQTSGTDGGSSNSAVWTTRVLNTVKTNEIDSASLASNQISLPAGTYYIEALAPAKRAKDHKARLRNITDGTTVLVGMNVNANTDDTSENTNHAPITGRFTLSGTKTLEIQHYVTNAQATDGFGPAVSSGEVEIYTDVRIWKVSPP